MNTDAKRDNAVDAMLKQAYHETKPPDSWEALRVRIDRKVDLAESSAVRLDRTVVFWRRTALAMAACFVLAAGLLIYITVFTSSNIGSRQRQPVTAKRALFDQAQLDQLSKTFSNVRQLFGQQLPWIMVGSGNDAEIGVDQMVGVADTSKVVIVRLAVNSDSQNTVNQYFDIVTFSNQQVNCQLPLTDAPPIDVSLRPVLENDGIVAVEISAKVSGDSESKTRTAVLDNAFTSLVRLRANGGWVGIDGVAYSMSNI
jgi:hypothetical protein